MINLLATLTLTTAAFAFQRWFLLTITILTLCGRWLYQLDILPKEYSFVCAYVELLIVFMIAIKELKHGSFDKISYVLFIIALSASTSLIYADEHFLFSMFFLICLLSGPFIYSFFCKNISYIIEKRIVDWTVLLWVALGIVTKYIIGLRSEESSIIQRGGGVFGSNHIGGILLMLLPFVRNKWLTFVTIVFLCLQFSRGIYAALIIYALLWAMFVNKKSLIKIIFAVGIAGIIIVKFLMDMDVVTPFGVINMREFWEGRFRIADTAYIIEGLKFGIQDDLRFKIWEMAREICNATGYLGVGLGGTWWALDKHGFFYLASNLHNMYLTNLMEGGLIFALLFAVFLLYVSTVAYRTSKIAFISLFVWSFYGIYSGELYEATRVPTMANYYYFLFIIAYIMTKKREMLNGIADDKC